MKSLKIGIVLLLLLIMPYPVKALDLRNIECKNDGSFEFTIEGTEEDEIYTKDMTVKIDGKTVNSTWNRESVKDSYSVNQRYATFSLPESSLTENRIYNIELDYFEDDQSKTRKFDAECPGLVFSCNLLHLNIDKCYTTNGQFTAEITAKGLKQSKLPYGFNVDPEKALDFTITTYKPYKAKTNIIYKRGPLPNEFTITELETEPDKYKLNFNLEQDNYVKEISVAFSEDRSFPLYMLDKCSANKYNIKLADHEVCSFYTQNKPIIVTQEQEDKLRTPVTETTINNKITGEVIKASSNLGNALIFSVIIIIILIAVIIILYSNIRKNKRKF